MTRSILKSWLLLLYVGWLMRVRGFERVHLIVRETSVKPMQPKGVIASSDLCQAIDIACVFYFKHVLCLQRSAATAILLRRHGWVAEMVIGVQMVPFKSHAWCEVNGLVVNDKPYMTEIYTVLERC
jgi:Transglutaminase-like superfamily